MNNNISVIARKPSKRLIQGLGLLLTIALLSSFLQLAVKQPWFENAQHLLISTWQLLAVILFTLAFYDWLRAKEPAKLALTRSHNDILPLHHWTTITLHIKHQQTKPTPISVSDIAVQTLEPAQQIITAQLLPQQLTTITYQVRALQRGDALISGVDILIPSALGLWQKVHRANLTATLKVYPDYKAINGYKLLALDNNASHMGIKKIPKRGEGMEFHQLREYMQGDTSRQIDWKATARKQKLISREYQDERDQQIIVMLDSGRRMRNHVQGLGHLDHSINAMVLLSHIALKQGDSVGLLSFSQQQQWLPGKKGAAHINTILNHVYHLQPQLHASDYSSAAQTLIKLQRKRSLVILITNTRDEDIDDLLPAIKLISKNHLVLLANIIEPQLQQTLETPVTNTQQLFGYCGTVDYLIRREKVKQRLTNEGVFTIDALPQDLAIKVCNSYLEIKRSGYL